jgi:hypothetical protein
METLVTNKQIKKDTHKNKLNKTITPSILPFTEEKTSNSQTGGG